MRRNIFVTSIGDRLKEERERLGYSQPAFGALGGKTKKTVMQWEGGDQYPNAAFLSAVAAQGADVQYILTGMHGAPALRIEQERAGYVVEVLSPAEAQALRALRASGALVSVSQTISGNANQVVGVNNGEVNGDKKSDASGGKRRR